MNDQTFRTKDVDIDYEQWSGKATLTWSYELEVRDWGIKDLNIHVPDQTIIVDWKNLDDDEKQPPEELELKDVKVTINATYNQALCPTSITEYKGEWEVSF